MPTGRFEDIGFIRMIVQHSIELCETSHKDSFESCPIRLAFASCGASVFREDATGR